MAKGSAAASYLERGRDIYNYRCYFCHGYNGDARTLAATYLTPAPRNFTTVAPGELSRQQMLETVAGGKPGTAMQAFDRILDAEEIAAVVDFIRSSFMFGDHRNTRYHTAANGWPDHERYASAFPFATGEVALDMPLERLSPAQREGRQLFVESCITCHDRARVEEEGRIWDRRSVSYPRGAYSHGQTGVDATSSASPYGQHDHRPPVGADLTAEEAQGERIFQANCAFCHGADGTGKNWIGSFLQPHPRNFTDPEAVAGLDRARLEQVIRDGLPGTTMSAWKSVLTQEQIAAVAAYVMKVMIGPVRAGDADGGGS